MDTAGVSYPHTGNQAYSDALDLARDGARLFPGAALSALGHLEQALAQLPAGRAGIRICGIEALHPLLADKGPIGAIAAAALGVGTRPVRAILFDKAADANWSLAWHQDRTICVKERLNAPGFGPWTIKAGMQHVAPPFDVLAQMVTLRVHIDAVPADNAPLLIAPGSHRLGRIAVDAIDEVVGRCGRYTCLAEAGDIWLYKTPILHASDAVRRPGRRRVLQIDFAACELPYRLEWLGV